MRTNRLIRFASWFAFAGVVVSIVQITLLALFFAIGEPFGHLNDEFVIVQYLLALPLILALHQLLHPRARLLSTVALLLGIVGILAITVLQILLLVGTLSFAQQGGPVSFALFVLFGGWLLMTGYLSRSQHLMQHSVLMSVLGWIYVGYPIWSFWLGRELGAIARGQASRLT